MPRLLAARSRLPPERSSARAIAMASGDDEPTAPAPLDDARPVVGAPSIIESGRAISGGKSDSASTEPSPITYAYSSTLRSSRTLPGQSCLRSAARAPAEMVATPPRSTRIQLVDELLRKQDHVVAARAKRRKENWNDAQAVHEIRAKASGLDLAPQRPVRGRDDADVHLDRVTLSDPRDLVGLEHAQHLRLEIERHLGHLVQKERAAVGQAELAGHVAHRARERSLRVSKELTLQERLRNGRAVDRPKRTARTRRHRVERLRDELLARAGVAAHQHRGVALGDLLDERNICFMAASAVHIPWKRSGAPPSRTTASSGATTRTHPTRL